MNVSFYSDLHPYECGQNCIHCRKEQTATHTPADCALCWDELLEGLNTCDAIRDLYATVFEPPRLLLTGRHPMYHSGLLYDDCDPDDLSLGIPQTEYLKDDWVCRLPAYRFKLSGGHAGPPIEVLMVEPQWEGDSYGGVYYCWTRLLWADDQSLFNYDYLLDTYTDPLRDELTEIAKGWD